MAGQEELRLTVSVDDQASAQLQGLRAQLSAMGGGAQAAGMERVRRQSTEVAGGFAGLSRELSTFATRAGVIGGVVGAISSKLIELGSNFVNRVTDVKGYSDAIVTLNKNATLTGTSAAQFQANMDLMRESTGATAEQAAAGLKTFGAVWTDLQKQNSQFRQSLLQQRMTPENRREMVNVLEQMRQTDPTNAANIWLDYLERVEKHYQSIGQAALGAQIKARELARVGLEGMDRPFRIVSPEQEQLAAGRTAGAKEFADAHNAASTAWGRMATSAASILTSVIPINQNMNAVKSDVEAGADALEKWEASLRKSGGLLNWIKQNAPGWLKGEPPPDTRTDRQKMQDAQMEAFRKREAEREAERAAQEARDRAARGAGPAMGRPPSAPVARPPGAAPSRFPPAQRAAPTVVVPPPAATAPSETEPGVVVDPAEQQRLDAEAARQAAEVEKRRRAAQPPRSVWDLLFGRGAQAQPPARQQFTAAGAVGPATTRFMPDPNFLAGHEANVGVAGGTIEDRRVIELQTTATQASTEEMQRLREAFEALKPPVPTATATQVTPSPTAEIVAPAPAPIIVPQQAPFTERFGEWPQPQQEEAPFGERFGEWPQPQSQQLVPLDTDRAAPPSAFAGGKFDLMGGSIMDQGQIGQALDTRALDRAASRDVNVNGTGKISVDVRAPAGTRVGAQGQGLFKTTEVNRQTQMLPAEYGPVAATGIGAGE
jgi:hypothetical protein